MTSNISDMGQMGEVILENILQDCGMTKNRDYQSQYTDQDEDGQTFRPDIVVFLPEKRNFIPAMPSRNNRVIILIKRPLSRFLYSVN